MPFVSVSLTAGRDHTVKSFLARSIVDSLSEVAGVTPEGVQVVFTDVDRAAWAIGPSLLSERTPRPAGPRPMPFVRVVEVVPFEGRRDAYLRWRRHRLYPVLATTEGFLTTAVVAGEADALVVTERWRTEEACQTFDRSHGELMAETTDVAGPPRTLVAGSVLDTWGAPA